MQHNTVWFAEHAYLNSKLEQLKRIDSDTPWDIDSIKDAIHNAGYTPLSHFETFGHSERTSPNPYFHAHEYLEAKLRQLETIEPGWYTTIDQVANAIEAAGMSIWQHFQQHGWKEDVNPSNAFDVSAYFESKLEELRISNPGTEWTIPEIKQAFEDAGFDPITHYESHGWREGVWPSFVPLDERVPSGPAPIDDPEDPVIEDSQLPPIEEPGQDHEIVVISISPQGWNAGQNHIKFNLQLDSDITLDRVSVKNSATFTSRDELTVGSKTTIEASVTTSNGQGSGTLDLVFLVPKDKPESSISLNDFKINGISYPGQIEVPLEDHEIEYRYSDLLNDYEIITETPQLDAIGEGKTFSNINEELPQSGAQLGLLEEGKPTNAYLHIEKGEDFRFDHDIFVMRVENSGTYRLKLAPEDPVEFGSNLQAKTYHPHGGYSSLIMNAIGDRDLVDGVIYSDPFFLNEGEDAFLSLSLRWNNSEDVWAVANGPAPYQIELIGDSQVGATDFFL